MAKLLKDDKTPVSAASDGTITAAISKDVAFTGKINNGNFEISHATVGGTDAVFPTPVKVALNANNEVGIRDLTKATGDAIAASKDVKVTKNESYAPLDFSWQNILPQQPSLEERIRKVSFNMNEIEQKLGIVTPEGPNQPTLEMRMTTAEGRA